MYVNKKLISLTYNEFYKSVRKKMQVPKIKISNDINRQLKEKQTKLHSTSLIIK